MTKRTFTLLFTLAITIWLSSTIAQANLGTVTAGTINGTTISGNTITGGTISGTTITGSTLEAGGGDVVIDSNGVMLDDGSGTANAVRWSGGGEVRGLSGSLFLSGAAIALDAPVFSDDINMHTNETITMNGTGSTIIFNNSNFQGSTQFVCVDTTGTAFASATACN